MKKSLNKRFPEISEDKYEYIPNGFDPTLCNYLHKHATDIKHEDFFTITYSGSLEYDRDPREFLMALKELFSERPKIAKKIRIDLVGNMEQEFVHFIHDQGLSSNIRFIGYLPYSENVKHLAASDLLFFIANDIRPDSIPGKIYEYLLLNKPILALVGTNVSGELLSSFPRARVVKPNDRKGMKDFIVESFKQYAKTGRQPWKLDKTTIQFCRRNQTRQLTQIYT